LAESFRTLQVPASSANLGPGFDALGLALNLYLTCRFRRAAQLAIRVSGRDADQIPAGADNLIWQIVRRIAGAVANVELEIENEIPIGKGLGSSAAAVTAGVVIGAELAGLEWNRARVLDEAARIEGHPDNVAACALGGVVASAMVGNATSDGETNGCAARAVRLELPARFGVAVIVPDFAVATSEARRVLPDSYSREDAIFNLQRSALLVAALATGASDAFPAALEDRLHQPYRFALVPGLEEITRMRAPGLLGCALSGAGPSILVFYERGHEEVVEQAWQIFSGQKKGVSRPPEILWTEIDRTGFRTT
jgi:homoserine kinase